MKRLVLLILSSLFLLGCINTGTNATLTAAINDTVQVNYVGSLQDGSVFDTSIQAEAQKAGLPLRPSYSPLEFTVGSHMVIAGFENGVVGMKVGENKTVTIPPADAYGETNAELIGEIPRENIQGELEIGSMLSGGGREGKIIALNETIVTVDFNHPLAGKTLIFQITLVNVTKA